MHPVRIPTYHNYAAVRAIEEATTGLPTHCTKFLVSGFRTLVSQVATLQHELSLDQILYSCKKDIVSQKYPPIIFYSNVL